MGIVMQEKEGSCRGHHWREKHELSKVLKSHDYVILNISFAAYFYLGEMCSWRMDKLADSRNVASG